MRTTSKNRLTNTAPYDILYFVMRVYFNGRKPASQAENAGSIPVTR